MQLLVIGCGMMGSAAAYDMARSAAVEAVTLADIDKRRDQDVAGGDPHQGRLTTIGRLLATRCVTILTTIA